MSEKNEILLLVDGNSLINRAYYATTLTNGATFGFINILLRAVENTSATHVAIAFDKRDKTFRHLLVDELIAKGDDVFTKVGTYKAHRHGMPNDLAEQFADLKVLLGAMKIAMFELSGYEADDLVGTIGEMAGEQGMNVVILTGDRDCLQLVSDRVSVCLTRNKGNENYTPERVKTEYGVEPKQLVDVKSLMGDKSDNIPGIHGIGEKGALKIIQQYGSLENSPHAENPSAKVSKVLAKIKCDIPIEIDFSKMTFSLPLGEDIFKAFKARNFYSFLRRENWWTEGLVEKTSKPNQEDPNAPKQLSFL